MDRPEDGGNDPLQQAHALPSSNALPSASPSPKSVREHTQRKSTLRRSADDIEEQRKENERLREMLARERFERIHRVAYARKDAATRTLSPLQPKQTSPVSRRAIAANSITSPTKQRQAGSVLLTASPELKRMSSPLSPKHDAKPCRSSSEQMHAEVSSPSSPPKLLRSKLLAPLHPLAVDQAASPGKTERYWFRRMDAIRTKEHDGRSQLYTEERHDFLLLHRVLRLLRKEEQNKLHTRELLHSQFEVRQSYMLDEIRGRIRLVKQREKAFIDGIVLPFELAARSFVDMEWRTTIRLLWQDFKKEQRLWRAVEQRHVKSKLMEHEALMMDCNEGRLDIVKEAASSFEKLHTAFSDGRESIRMVHHQHIAAQMDEKRRKRAEALEAELLDEKLQRQARQKVADAKHNEEKKLHASWADWEVFRSRVVHSEHEMWMLLMRIFRVELATVRSLAKLQRVEGYCYDALKEMPTVTLTQLLQAPPSSAYASQVSPLPQFNKIGRHSLPPQPHLPGQNRVGMQSIASFFEPIRRDREPLPKYLKMFMEDETCPLFVGSYIPTGGMFVDPSVEFSIDMGENWGARLLVCWSYAKEESETLARQIIRKMLGCLQSADKLIDLLGTDGTAFRRSQSKKSLVKTKSSMSLDARTELLSTSLQDIAKQIPSWVQEWRQMLCADLQEVRKRFPNVPLPDGAVVELTHPLPTEDRGGQSTMDGAANPISESRRQSAVVMLPPTAAIEPERATINPLSFSPGITPVDSALSANSANGGSFVLDINELQKLQAPLIAMKAAKERLTAAVVRMDALSVPGSIFADGEAHRPLLSLHPEELEEVLSIYPEACVHVSHPQQGHSNLEVRIAPSQSNTSGFVSSYIVRDIVRLARLCFADQVDEWAIPKTGIAVCTRVRVRCNLTTVPESVSIAEAASLNELLEEVLQSSDTVDHESDEVLESFILPFQVYPQPVQELASASIPEHDCRLNKPFHICQNLQMRLAPRLERHEEVTTEIEGWESEGLGDARKNASFSITSRRSSAAVQLDGGAQSPGIQPPPSLVLCGSGAMPPSNAASPPQGVLSSPSLSSSYCPQSPKSPVLSPSKKIVSLKKETVRRRTTIVLPNGGAFLDTCEAKGLEVTFSIFDGVNLHDKLTIVDPDHHPGISGQSNVPQQPPKGKGGVLWDTSGSGSSSVVTVDGVEVASALQQLCSLRIAFLPHTPIHIVERVCHAVAIHCDQYKSRIGIRVVQVVVSRPYDKLHAPATARWVAPSAAYVAVNITATDTPPTFTLPPRVCYRGAFAGSNTTSKGSTVTPRATLLQHQAEEASKLWRLEPRKLMIAKDAVIEDQDTQFFRGGSLTIDVRTYEPGDHIALELREFDSEQGVDGVRMQFIEDPRTQVASEMPQAWESWYEYHQRMHSSGEGGTDTACALLSFHGEAVGLLMVVFHVTSDHRLPSEPNLTRRQSAVWGDTTQAATDAKVIHPSVMRRRKSSVSFPMKTAGPRQPALSHDSTSKTAGNEFSILEGSAMLFSIDLDTDNAGVEPQVQKPLSSLQGGSEDGCLQNPPQAVVSAAPFTTNEQWSVVSPTAKEEPSTTVIEGVSKLHVCFEQRVPFEVIQHIVQSVVYYRGTLLVPTGETLVDITVAPGQTIECFDVHGDMVIADTEDGTGVAEPMVRTVTIERSPPLLTVPEKDRACTYVENSGARRLLSKIPPLPADVAAFEGGYLRVEICPEDLEAEDEILLDVPLEKIRRIFLKLDMIQEHLPDTLGSNRQINRGSRSGTETKDRPIHASSIDMRAKVAQERVQSFHTIDSTPREPPHHGGPPVAVSALRRLGSMKRSKSARQDNSSGSQPSPMWSPQEASMPRLHDSPSPLYGLAPPSASSASLPATISSQMSKNINLWGKVKRDVNAATSAHRFIHHAAENTTAAVGEAPPLSTLYAKVFDLVRQSASSQVLVRRMEELERYGIDDTFVYRMQQNDIAQGLQAAPISTAATDAGNTQTAESPRSKSTPAGSKLPAATVCCLADFDDNSLGTLFSRHGCLSVAFDPLLPSIVLKGHTLPVQPQTVIQKLLSNIAFRSTSRNPSILQKRITVTLSHPISGRTVVFLKVNIDPVDDPTEVTTLKTQVSIRAQCTEEEPYSEALVNTILSHRSRHGVNLAMPESSVEKGGGSWQNPASCIPRWGIVPLLPQWCTTVFDPDTTYWDGGRIELHVSQVCIDSANFSSKVTPGMRQALQNGLRLLTAAEQRELHRNIARYNLQDPSAGPAEGPPTGMWVLSARHSPHRGEVDIYMEHEDTAVRNSDYNGRLLATIKNLDANEGATALLSIAISDELIAGEKWITVDMLEAILNCICVEIPDVVQLVMPLEFGTDAGASPTRSSLVFPISVKVWDAVNPNFGQVVLSLDLCAPLIAWPRCSFESISSSPDGSPSAAGNGAKERRQSVANKTPTTRSLPLEWPQWNADGEYVVYVSLRESTAVQGEPCLQNLTIRLSDRDRVGGGFVELIPLSGCHPEDRFTVLPPSNQMVVTTDGVITSKEGNLGRVYGNNSSVSPYLRVDLAGYWFEGSKKLSYPTNKQDLAAPPGINASTGSGRITPHGGVVWSKQVGGRVTGKRLSALLRSIYFRTEIPDGVGVSTLTGVRRFTLNVSDGKYDVYGRLEVISVPLVINVIDATLPKF